MVREAHNVTPMPERKERDISVRGPGAVGTLRSEMNHLFDRFAGRDHGVRDVRDPFDLFDLSLGRAPVFAQADMSETDAAWELQLDLPGMKKDDVAVDYNNGVVTISGERRDEREDKRRGYYLSERSHGAFERSFRVPEGVKVDDIEARFDEGVLSVKLPKSEEARERTHRIEVKG